MINKLFNITILVFSFQFLSILSFAAETDGYSGRYLEMKDGLPQVNAEIQRRALDIISTLNLDHSPSCDWADLNSKLGSKFRRPIYGEFEYFINNQKGLPRFKIALSDSVFKNLPMVSFLPILAGTAIGIGFAPNIHHDGLLIGSDKLGHFMDEGYYYYLSIHKMHQTITEMFRLGTMMEETFDGLWTSGIFSYGDLSANYDGYLFWKDALGTPEDREISKYFSCSGGIWKIKTPIDLGLYVNPAWDEGMNCNRYRSSSMSIAVDQAVKEMEQREGRRYQCPVYPNRIGEMILHYGAESKYVIHPEVLKLAR